MSFFAKLLKPFTSRQNPIARKAYDQIVAQSRQIVFYENERVADTVTGRFDMIVVNAFLLFHRLKRRDDETEAVLECSFPL